MYHSHKKITYFLCIVGALLIATGVVLSIKRLMDGEELFNVADDNESFRVMINLNGANSVEHKYVKCKITPNGCSVTLPNATRRDGIVIGYSSNSDSTEAEYQMNETITINENRQLYVISYKTNTLSIMNNNVDYLEKSSIDCKAFNTNRECDIILPRYNKVGYENKGYSINSDSTSGGYFPGEKISISKNETIYPIYSTSSRHRIINVSKTLTYKDSFIEIENGCTESVYNKYLGYLDGISKNVPFLLIGNKISFIVDGTFNAIWGNGYVGMNYGPKSLRSVDVRCSSNSLNDYYATMVHEMAHSWDFYYGLKTGKNISSQNDIINLFSKYSKAKNRPFRDYSYSNIYEFVADMMRYYYFKYYVPTYGFKSSIYPSDIKKALEKYICISKNDYQEDKCK